MKSGLILIDKPQAMTSFDCIRDLKRMLKRTDLGHGGTLDRFATGLLPVFFGEGLKLVRFFQESFPTLPTYWKTYEGTIKLGERTETGDPEGAVVASRAIPSHLNPDTIQTIMTALVGSSPFLQKPPIYSAKKIDGQRSSDLARAGKNADLAPVEIELQRFECLEYDQTLDEIKFRVTCSKGTYVRVLAEDLAQKLETEGHLTKLRRTEIGGFRVDEAYPLRSVDTPEAQDFYVGSKAMDLATASRFLPRLELLAAEVQELKVGSIKSATTRILNSRTIPGPYCLVAHADPAPLALAEVLSDQKLKLLRCFV